MIFLSCCASVEFHFWVIKQIAADIPAFQLHRKLSQKKRSKNYHAFTAATRGVLLTTDLGSRGIDVAGGLDWIVQFDPPKNLETFVHRAGRTARAGSCGNCILFLLSHELDFLKLLKVRNLDCQEYIAPHRIETVKLEKIKEKLLEDRADYNRASSGFIGHVRSYKELDLKYIFKFAKLDIADLAKAYSLASIPHVKEFPHIDRTEEEGKGFKVSKIPFRNKNQEKQVIQNKLKREQKLLEKQERKKEKVKKESKKESEKEAKKKRSRAERRKAKRANMEKEWDELAREANLLKKLKKGKISEKEFEEELNLYN